MCLAFQSCAAVADIETMHPQDNYEWRIRNGLSAPIIRLRWIRIHCRYNRVERRTSECSTSCCVMFIHLFECFISDVFAIMFIYMNASSGTYLQSYSSTSTPLGKLLQMSIHIQNNILWWPVNRKTKRTNNISLTPGGARRLAPQDPSSYNKVIACALCSPFLLCCWRLIV